jgi:hypothetical protein
MHDAENPVSVPWEASGLKRTVEVNRRLFIGFDYTPELVGAGLLGPKPTFRNVLVIPDEPQTGRTARLNVVEYLSA